MTKMVMKFPPYIEKNLSKIINIDKPHENHMKTTWKIMTLFKLFTDYRASIYKYLLDKYVHLQTYK